MRIIEQHLDLNLDNARALYLGAIDLGDRERSREWTDRALALDPDDPAVLYNVACAYAQLGLVEKALDCLERCTLNGAGHRAWIENDPDLNTIRSHARFRTILAKLQPVVAPRTGGRSPLGGENEAVGPYHRPDPSRSLPLSAAKGSG